MHGLDKPGVFTTVSTNLSDTLNGFRAVHRQAAMSVGLREDTHTIEQEMVMKMLRHGYRVMNIPTHEYPRKFGKSHINIWKEWPKFAWCVVVNLLHKYPPKNFVGKVSRQKMQGDR